MRVSVVILLFCFFVEFDASAADTGTICGFITGNGGQPVEGASITLLRGGYSMTDKHGCFTVDVPSGKNMIYIQADGYYGFTSDYFNVPSGDTVKFVISLKEKMVMMNDIVVTSSPIVTKVEAPVSMRRFIAKELTVMPGANLDVSKVVQAMPGVVPVSTSNRNDLLVRGGGANENRYILDGVEIPVLNHFAVQGGSGGNASIVNTELLQSVDFYTSAFPVQYSNGLSSVLSMNMKTGNSDRFHGKITVGTSDAGAILDTPLSRNGKTTFIASYRRSYLDVLFRILKLPFLPVYNDFQFKISEMITEKDELFLLGLGSVDNNRLNTSLKTDNEGRKYILGYLPANDQLSYVVGLGYKRKLDEGLLQATISRNYFRNELYKHEDNDNNKPEILNLDSRETEYRARFTAELWNISGFRITAGCGFGYARARNVFVQPSYSDAGMSMGESRSKVDLWRYELFGSVNRSFAGDKLSLSAGARIEGMSYSSLTANPLRQLSPRISAEWRISRKWDFNVSVGRYYQEPSYTVMAYSPADGSWRQSDYLRYMAVNHYVAGIGFKPTDFSNMKIEGFYKEYMKIPVSMLDTLPVSTGDFADYIVGNVPVQSVGKGRAYGVEFSYRSFDLANVIINLSYTIFRSQLNLLDDDLLSRDVYVSSSFDVGHILNISVLCDWGRGWSSGIKWHITGGYPYTPYDEQLSSLIWAWDIRNRPYPDYDLYNHMRSAAYHQLDIRLDKVWNMRKWSLSVYLDIQNVYDFKAAGQPILMPRKDAAGNKIEDASNPGHYEMKYVSREFGGTILPTIGISVRL